MLIKMLKKDSFKDFHEQIKQLIVAEKESEALALLMKERNNPLFNIEQQNMINTMIIQLTKFIKHKEQNNFLATSSKADLLKMFITKDYDLVVLDTLLQRFAKSFDQKDFLKLQTIFLDENINNDLKINFLNIFKSYDLDYDFVFVNNNFKKTTKVNPKGSFQIIDNDLMHKVSRDLQAMFFKETTKENIANQIINKIYVYYFNHFDEIKYSPTELFDHIVNFIEYSFNSSYKVDPHFLNWLKKILK